MSGGVGVVVVPLSVSLKLRFVPGACLYNPRPRPLLFATRWVLDMTPASRPPDDIGVHLRGRAMSGGVGDMVAPFPTLPEDPKVRPRVLTSGTAAPCAFGKRCEIVACLHQ